MNEPVVYQNIEQACDVLDSVCASPLLPSTLYNWQKEAWCFIRAYIKESQKTSANNAMVKPCATCDPDISTSGSGCIGCQWAWYGRSNYRERTASPVA